MPPLESYEPRVKATPLYFLRLGRRAYCPSETTAVHPLNATTSELAPKAGVFLKAAFNTFGF
jgi:hypothetical protein